MPGDSIFSDDEEAAPAPAPPPDLPSTGAVWDSPNPHEPSPPLPTAAAPSPEQRPAEPPGVSEVSQRDAAADEERRQRLRQVLFGSEALSCSLLI